MREYIWESQSPSHDEYTACNAIRIFRILASDEIISETEIEGEILSFSCFLQSRMLECSSLSRLPILLALQAAHKGSDRIARIHFSRCKCIAQTRARRNNFNLKQLRYFEFTNSLFPFQREDDGRVRDFLLANASLPGC